MPKLVASCMSDLWATPWRDIVSQHGVDVDEFLSGRGPTGLARAHLAILDDMPEDRAIIDEITCLALERHDVCPATMMAIATFVPDLVVTADDGAQVAAVGSGSSRVSLGDWNSSPHWFRQWTDVGTLERLPPLPEMLRIALPGRPAAAIADHPALGAPGAVVTTASGGTTSAQATIRGMALHSGPGLAKRACRAGRGRDERGEAA